MAATTPRMRAATAGSTSCRAAPLPASASALQLPSQACLGIPLLSASSHSKWALTHAADETPGRQARRALSQRSRCAKGGTIPKSRYLTPLQTNRLSVQTLTAPPVHSTAATKARTSARCAV